MVLACMKYFPEILCEVSVHLVIEFRIGELRFHYLQLVWRFLDAFETLRKATVCFDVSVCLSVSLWFRPPAWNNSAPTKQTLMKIGIWAFVFRKSVEKIRVPLKPMKNDEYFT